MQYIEAPAVLSDELTEKIEQVLARAFLASPKTEAFLRSKLKRDQSLQEGRKLPD
jgi:hypothetical protein